MARSQNGWSVVGRDDCDQGPFEGVRFPNGIRKGDVATIARWQLRRYRATVEPLVNGTCWGWYVKEIEGSSTISNHSSGTAWDINAPQNPMGVATSRSMSQRQIDACHAIERASGGVLRWGGDFSRPDPMHWEIVGSPTQAAAFARKIRTELQNEEEKDVPLTKDMIKISEDVAEAAFSPSDEGEEHSAAELLSLTLIHAARANKNAAQATANTAALVKSNAQIVSLLTDIKALLTQASTRPIVEERG